MYYKQETGRFGEDKVKEYLENNKYLIVGENFQCRFGEIDIIARDVAKNELVFIEVKTRNSLTYGNPAEAVDFRKKKHIQKTMEYFLYIHKLENEFIRIDVIEVYMEKDKNYTINHIKQAF